MKKFILSYAVALALLCVIPINSALAAIITSAGDAALTGATVIDFSGHPKGTYASIAIGGVTFVANNNHLWIDNTYEASYGQVGNYLDNGTYNSNGFNGLTIQFSNPTSAFGFQWDMAETWANWTLSAYNASNVLLGSYVLPNTDGSSTGAFVGLAFSDISYATLVNSQAYDWVSIDNFTYQQNAVVPIPTAVILLGSGILGLLGFRRKFNK
ncbi:MAG: hypothetical protein ABFD02_05315 [Bacteroidales bacterium]